MAQQDKVGWVNARGPRESVAWSLLILRASIYITLDPTFIGESPCSHRNSEEPVIAHTERRTWLWHAQHAPWTSLTAQAITVLRTRAAPR